MAEVKENWRPVPGAEMYSVSDLGRVKGPRRMLIQHPDDGYLKVTLCIGAGIRITKRVHDLVLSAFVGPRPEGHVSRHLDGARDHNSLANLAWGTQADNENDKVRHGTSNRGEGSGRAKLTWETVKAIRAEYQPGVRGRGHKSLARKYGVAASIMYSVLRGKSWVEEAAR